jgi:hypothetical protein
VADTLPIGTDSLAREALTSPAPSAEHHRHCYIHEGAHCSCGAGDKHLARAAELAEAAERQRRAEEHLAACAAAAGMTPDAYCRRGLLAEWHHQLDDPAVPYSPYLTTGGAS